MALTRTTANVTLDEIRDRATIPVHSDREPSAAGVFGVGRGTAYALARSGQLPTIRLGSRVVVPVPALLRMLGDEPPSLSSHQDSRRADPREQAASHETSVGTLTSERG